MKIVLAPDKFKGSLTGMEFCAAVKKGLHKVLPEAEIVSIPLADGGDGTLDVLARHLDGRYQTVDVWDPLMRTIKASYLIDTVSKTAFIEMARASGLSRLEKKDQNCYFTTSYGTGQLMAHALDSGVRQIILGIGGSATNDCGIGMAAALGYLFLDAEGKELIPIGKNMVDVKYIADKKIHPALRNTEIMVLCDVFNPLFGREGAAYVYASQKGASENEIKILDRGLKNMSVLIANHFNNPVAKIPGSGAAGGMGAGALAFLHANLVLGTAVIKDLVRFDEQIEGADWIITGEGKLDAQTLSGKTIHGVMESAHNQNINLALLCGSSSMNGVTLDDLGINYSETIMDLAKGKHDAIKHAATYVELMAVEFGVFLRGKS